MKDEMFNDAYYREDFNDDWGNGHEEDDDFSINPDDINDRIEWMEDIDDPDLLEDFNFEEFEDLEDGTDEFNFDE